MTPTPHTRRVAVAIVARTRTEGTDALRLLDHIQPGQEVALIGVLARIAAGLPLHRGPGGNNQNREAVKPELNLIACPVCRVGVASMCRTATGRTRAPHPERIIGRRCPCGDVLPTPRARFCNDCAANRRRAAQVEYQRRARAKKRAARDREVA